MYIYNNSKQDEKYIKNKKSIGKYTFNKYEE